MTPARAVAEGADWIVVGPITGAAIGARRLPRSRQASDDQGLDRDQRPGRL